MEERDRLPAQHGDSAAGYSGGEGHNRYFFIFFIFQNIQNCLEGSYFFLLKLIILTVYETFHEPIFIMPDAAGGPITQP